MNAYTEKSNLLAKQRFYEEMAPNDLSRAFYIHKSGSVIGWRSAFLRRRQPLIRSL